MTRSPTLEGVDKPVRGPGTSAGAESSSRPAGQTERGEGGRRRRPDGCLSGHREGSAPKTEGHSLMISILILFCFFVPFQEPKAPFPLAPGRSAGPQQNKSSSRRSSVGSAGLEHRALWGLGGLGGGACLLSPIPFPHLQGQMGTARLT